MMMWKLEHKHPEEGEIVATLKRDLTITVKSSATMSNFSL